ncbi:YdbC family protein [Peribacillus sp. NPDC097675]|uniref:YdbC family protein n=1 Tax=Peribacillus sp. NPDC097675 TaxID=3390618 RepID=UPI003D00C024
MIIKWIKCQIDKESKYSFSKAQERWSKLKNSEGFLGQIGGWDKNKPFEAGILSFWKDYHSYEKFMKYHHDGIFENSNQKNTYHTISVKIFEKLFDIGSIDFTRLLREGNLLRIAECYVDLNRQFNFEHAQKEVWNKGMTDTSGMLAGIFCRNPNHKEMYLVASLWSDNLSHQSYVDNKLPLLIQNSGVKDPAIRITGNLLEINSKWLVL